MNRSISIALAAAALVVAAAPASAGTSKSVKVGDNFFSPNKLTVAPKTKIVWKWDPTNSESHDVFTTKWPKGAKKFQSDPATADFRYSKTLTVPGTYKIICTFHEDMTQTITVKRPTKK